MKDDTYRKQSLFLMREREMIDLEVIIAKYYLPNELFVGQVEEIISLLTESFARHFPLDQAVNKANRFVLMHYLGTEEA